MDGLEQLLHDAMEAVLTQFPGMNVDGVETTISEFINTLENIRLHRPMQHLSVARIGMMSNAIGVTTFRMQLIPGQIMQARFVNDAYGVVERIIIPLNVKNDFARANLMQVASVLVESINLVLKVIGIQFPSERIITVIEDVCAIVEKNTDLKGQINAMRTTDNNQMVKQMLNLVVIAYKQNVLVEIIQKYYSDPVGIHLEECREVSAKISGFCELMKRKDNGCEAIAELVNTMDTGGHDTFFINLKNLDNYNAIRRASLDARI